MSLAIVLAGADGLVLAADSRVTEGYSLDGPRTRDDSIKFEQLNHTWGILTYGIAGIGREGILCLKEEVACREDGFKSLPDILEGSRAVLEKTSADWSGRNPGIIRRDKDVGFILAGYDQKSDTFGSYNLQSPAFAPKSSPTGCLIAGQWHLAKYFLDRLYAKNQSVDVLRSLAVILLNATMAVDPQVGGSVRLATVTRGLAFRWDSPDEIETLKRIYQVFYGLIRERCGAALAGASSLRDPKEESGDLKDA